MVSVDLKVIFWLMIYVRVYNNCGMIKSVIITRLAGALVLCQSNEGYMDEQILNVKHKVKKYHSEVTMYSKAEPNKLKHIDHPTFAIFYKIHNYVVFTVIADKNYPIKLAGAFIESIISPFFDQVKTLFTAAHYESKLESLTTQLYFIKFDRRIKEKKREFDDPNSVKNVDRMKRELQNISEIMKQNMSLLQGRQEDLIQTFEKAKRINEQSKRFDQGTKKILWQYWLKKHLVWIIVILTALIIYFLI